MLFYPPFNLPFFNNSRYLYNNPSLNKRLNNIQHDFNKQINTNEKREKVPEDNETSEAFFEILGLKLFFDDVLILCIIYFLYTEKTKNEELFICLILLLLS